MENKELEKIAEEIKKLREMIDLLKDQLTSNTGALINVLNKLIEKLDK